MIDNTTFTTGMVRDLPTQYVNVKMHAISGTEIFIVVAGYIALIYWWIVINKNREHWEKWTNPSGRVVNVYKMVRLLFWLYPVVVIVCGALQIYLFLKGNGLPTPI